MPTVYHMVHYRRFDASGGGAKKPTAESLCRTALNTMDTGQVPLWKRPESRLWDVGSHDGRRVFLNNVADLSSAVFGEMCLAQVQDVQAILSMNTSEVQLSQITTAVVYNLHERSAPSGSQFIRGIAYWISIGNHILFVKTHSMSADLIEGYLDWLLKTGTNTLPKTTSVSLHAELDKSQVAGDIGDVRSLRVSGRSSPQMSITLPEDGAAQRQVKTSRRIADKFAQMQQAVPIIEALLGQSKTDSLVESLGPEEYLAVEATVKIQGRRTQSSKNQFQAIANDVADMPDAKVRVEGKYGRISDGDAFLRTRMPFNLAYEGSNLLEFDNVADQLQEVYSRLVKDAKIKA